MSRLALAALLALAAPLGAQLPAERPEPIKDNSFLVEEAYNQEAGGVQHVSAFGKALRGQSWAYSFTQEWPMPSQRHQVSLTLPVSHLDGVDAPRGLGDVLLNYRWQALGVGGGAVSAAPRVSLVLPTGSARDGLGGGGAGVQTNLPLSVEHGDRLVTHWNAGFTWTPRAQDAAGATAAATSWAAAQSVVWLATPRVNVLVETAWSRSAAVAGADATVSSDQLFVAPGVRWSHDLPRGLQVVPGVAVPIGVGPSRGERSVFLYLSFEHPF
jgi:hypothetical protein